MEESMFVAVMLASRGFGTVASILRSPSDHVVAMLDFARYKDEFERTAISINSSGSGNRT